MTARSPTMLQVLEGFVSERLDDLHTAMPGTIESFDAAKQTANVKLLLKKRVALEDGTFADRSMGVAINVPIVFPAAGAFRITFPVKAGDGVLVVFAEASIDRWQAVGGEQPTDVRRFHLADAIAIPGLNPSTKTHAGFSSQAMTLGHDSGPGVVLSATDVQLGARDGSAATESVLLGTTAVADVDSLTTDLLQQLGQLIGFVSAAAAALTTAGVTNAIPIVGGIIAAPSFAVVVSQFAAIATALGQMIATVTTLKVKAQLWKSPTVKTR